MSVRKLVAALAAVVGLAGVLAVPAWGYWSQDANVSGTTITDYTVHAPTNVQCQLTKPVVILFSTFWQGLTVSATVPTDPGLSYAMQVIRIPDGSQIGPDHPLTLSGSTVTYVFTNNEFPGISTDVHTDFFARFVVRLTNAPTWQATSQINFDEDDSTGLFGITAGFYYGSPIGSTSPGGQPGACTT
jgi:hypothetical protein